MTRRHFVVSTDPLSVEQEKQFKDSLSGIGWWHWLPNFWLIIDPDGKLTVGRIRNLIQKANDQARCIVIQVKPITWASLSKPDATGRDMMVWVRNEWDKEDSGEE